MTVINNTHRFIYIHVPKTGGTSLKLYLDKFGEAGDVCLTTGVHSGDLQRGSADLRKHSSARDICRYLGEAEFGRYFRFSIVRNPFERANSIFHFLKFKFRSWPRSEIMDQFDSLEDMVVSKFFRCPGPGGIFEPQTSWLMLKGQIAVNFLARLETLDADMAGISRRLSLGEQPLPIERKNVSRVDDNEPHMAVSPGAIDAIRIRYAADFQWLGYSPDPTEKLVTGQEIDCGEPRMMN